MHEGRRVPDGTSHPVRAKIDMASPNINLLRPGHLPHPPRHPPPQRRRWCVSDTPSPTPSRTRSRTSPPICIPRVRRPAPFYDWLLDNLAEGGFFPAGAATDRVRGSNLTYVVLSKRKPIQLVDEKHVAGWDDPRLPTWSAPPPRLHTPKVSGASPSASASGRPTVWIDYVRARRLHARRSERTAERRVAVLDPLKLIITNYPDRRDRALPRPQPPAPPGARQARDALRP